MLLTSSKPFKAQFNLECLYNNKLLVHVILNVILWFSFKSTEWIPWHDTTIRKKMNNECFEMIRTNKLSRFESDVSFSSSMMHHHYSLHFIKKSHCLDSLSLLRWARQTPWSPSWLYSWQSSGVGKFLTIQLL